MSPSHYKQSYDSRELNHLIDQALLDTSSSYRQTLLDTCTADTVKSIAERIRRQATRLARSRRSEWKQILVARDNLILAVYRHTTPQNWYCGWFDGSVKKIQTQSNAGIGGLLMDTDGTIVVQIEQLAKDLDAFETELEALKVMLEAALEKNISHLRIHTDCDALVKLWIRNRDDPRLEEIRNLIKFFKDFELKAIPRQHNQSAHALAKKALHRLIGMETIHIC